jgi:cytoskeletal protein RodZ
MKNIYNENENKNSKLIKDLQNLPKIETPENFEYNLMTRIENKNFGIVGKERQSFSWIKFLAPSAVVLTAIILLFVFFPSSQQIDNPIFNPAQNVDSHSIVSNDANAGTNLTANNSQSKNKSAIPDINSSSSFSASNPQNSAKSKLPLNTSRSVSLDDYLNGGTQQRNMQRGNIVNSGNEPMPYDGFFISEKPDQNTLKKLRAEADSLRKARLKPDSLKKVQKMP